MPRKEFTVADRTRSQNHLSDRLIILSCEGVITEEEYFNILSDYIFVDIQSKIKIRSVRKNYLKSDHKTKEERDYQNRSSPKHILDRMNTCLEQEIQRSEQDECWLVMDIDDHTSPQKIAEWEGVLSKCKEKGYQVAISNPFFEFWLYLHHLPVQDEDHQHCVSEEHPYCSDEHFTTKMQEHSVGLRGRKKKPLPKDYNYEKLQDAVKRAKELERSGEEYPKNHLGSTVYKIIEKLIEMKNQMEKSITESYENEMDLQ